MFPKRFSIVSLKLIRAVAYTCRDFVVKVIQNETLQVQRAMDLKEWIGILYSDDSHQYSSLVVRDLNQQRTPLSAPGRPRLQFLGSDAHRRER